MYRVKYHALPLWALFFSITGAAFAQTVLPVISSQNLGVVEINETAPGTATLSYQISGFSYNPGFVLQYNTEFFLGQVSCSASSCTLPVTFSPKYPGLREDAVRVSDG